MKEARPRESVSDPVSFFIRRFVCELCTVSVLLMSQIRDAADGFKLNFNDCLLDVMTMGTVVEMQTSQIWCKYYSYEASDEMCQRRRKLCLVNLKFYRYSNNQVFTPKKYFWGKLNVLFIE